MSKEGKKFFFFGTLILALVLAGCASAQQSGRSSTGNVQSDTGNLNLLLRQVSSEIQKWDDGNDRRNVKVYSLDPPKKDELFQAVKNAGFYQVGTGENSRDWYLQSAVLRWCVSPNIDKWPNEIQVSDVGEKIVHIYGFKPLPDVYFTAVKDSTFGNNDIITIAYGGGKFLAGCDGGKIAYSTDGVTWTAVKDSTFGNNEIITIAYGGGKFVAGSDGGKIAYSTDGVTWTAVKDNIFSNCNNFHIAYGGSKFVATGFRGGSGVYKMAYSSDGVTWTEVKDKGNIGGFAYGSGKFVAVGAGGNTAYSTDGVTWTTSASGVPWITYPNGNKGGGQFSSVAYGAGKFVAVGGAWDGSMHKRMAYSTDGETWVLVSALEEDGYISSIVYGGGKFVAHSWDKMAYSTDGVIWTVVENSPLTDVNAIAYGGNKFVGVGREGKIAYSNMLE